MSFAHKGNPPDSFGSLGRAENDVVHPRSDQNELERINLIDQEQDQRERERERGFCENRKVFVCVGKSWWLNLCVRDGVGIGAGRSTHTPQST